MTNQSLSHQIPFDYPSKNNNKTEINTTKNRYDFSAFKNNENLNLKNNDYSKEFVYSLEAKLSQEYLKNNELKNYIKY